MLIHIRVNIILYTSFFQHPAICQAPSNAFYDGKLEAAISVKQRAPLSRKLDSSRFWPATHRKPVVFCDIVGTKEFPDPNHLGSADSRSALNKEEASKVV